MQLNQIRYRGFRNLRENALTFSPTFNLIVGDNGQGKTNLLELLFLLASLKSFRGAKRLEMVQRGETDCSAEAEIEVEELQKTVGFSWKPTGRQIFLNQNKVEDSYSYFSAIRAVCFAPEDAAIVGGSPGVRRRLIDRMVFQREPQHWARIQKFSRILKQRNAWLRQWRGRRPDAQDELAVWTAQLERASAEVTLHRLQTLRLLNERLPEIYAEVVRAGVEQGILAEPLTLSWQSKLTTALGELSGGEIPSTAAFAELYRVQARAVEQEEYRRGVSLWGAHLEDFVPCYGKLAAAGFASTGQKKTLVLTLRFAELDLSVAHFGEAPLLLLDDLGAELDPSRCERLLELLQRKMDPQQPGSGQIFLTTAAPTSLWLPATKNAKIFQVQAGAIKEISSKSK